MTKQQFDQLAHEIAQSTVRSDIESYCVSEHWSGRHYGRWYDTCSASEGIESESVERAVRYLEHWGELERNPESLALVRFKEKARVAA